MVNLRFCFRILWAAFYLMTPFFACGWDLETKRIEVLEGRVTLEVPVNWVSLEKGGKMFVALSKQDAIELGYVALMENDPKVDLDEAYLKRFLKTNVGAEEVKPLSDGRLMGFEMQTTDSGDLIHRWSVIKAIGKSHIAVVLVTHPISKADLNADRQIIEAVKSAVFTVKK